jgi:hypothetical protein
MKTLKQINQVLKQHENDFTFSKPFNRIIKRKLVDYNDKKQFFLDMQFGGCVSGMIGEFIYHNDCMKFYTKHIEDLETFKSELEENVGEIVNRNNQPHYTFMVWLAFEEHCYHIYNIIFE